MIPASFRTAPRTSAATIVTSVVVTALAIAVAIVPASLTAQAIPAAKDQINAAVLALPAEMRDGAGVLGYRTAGKLEALRPSRNGMLCLADDPAEKDFHVSCYHDAMEPFMLRGRQLRANGVQGTQVDTVRFAEVKTGKLKMPVAPASLYQIFAPENAYDAASNTVKGGRSTFVVYIPYATAESTGLSTKPSSGPWLMLPGTPKAHIMFSHTM